MSTLRAPSSAQVEPPVVEPPALMATSASSHVSAPSAAPRPAPTLLEPEVPPPGSGPGPVGQLLERWLPPLLLVISWIVGWISAHSWLGEDLILPALVPTVGLLALRVLLERTRLRSGPGSPVLVGLYLLHLVLVAVTLLLNPLTCIYAFVGYIDASRFLTGRHVQAVVVVTALLCAVGQIGGIRVVLAVPTFFAGLAVVNLLIALGMTYLAEERERALEQRERDLAEIARVNAENSRLHQELLAAARREGVDEERERLSQEIHDTVAQGLVGVIRQLEAVRSDIDPDSRGRVQVAEEAARDALLEARRAVEALGPHQLHEAGVVEALSGLVARWARAHRVVATFDADHAPAPGPHAEVLVRLAQEALANVARHSGAGAVLVTYAGDEDEQRLEITDDGVGFELRTAPRGHGLGNMHERARRAGGSLEVLSSPGGGCTVRAVLPR